MTDQQSRAGRNAGIAAGVAALLAAGAAGFVWWEGTVFDAAFADFGKRLADEGSRTGLTVTKRTADLRIAVLRSRCSRQASACAGRAEPISVSEPEPFCTLTLSGGLLPSSPKKVWKDSPTNFA